MAPNQNHYLFCTSDVVLLKIVFFISSADIDECKNKNRCGKNAKCVNLPGSYECKCNTGFVGKGTACFGKNFNNSSFFKRYLPVS